MKGGERVLYVSGQTSNDANGAPMHDGDIVAQFKLAWANLVEVLEASGMTAANIVRLNLYTTDVDAFMAAAAELVPVWAGAVQTGDGDVARRHAPVRAEHHGRDRGDGRRLIGENGGDERPS